MIRLILALLLLSFPAHAELSGKLDETACFGAGCFNAQDLTEVEVFLDMEFERIIDGDTFVASNRKIRLWGIDAPESNEPAGWAATKLLEGLLGNHKELGCKLVDVDIYKRDVMHCFIDGMDVGSMMVQMGMATDYQEYSGGYYRFEEDKAREAGKGIWKEYKPATPE